MKEARQRWGEREEGGTNEGKVGEERRWEGRGARRRKEEGGS